MTLPVIKEFREVINELPGTYNYRESKLVSFTPTDALSASSIWKQLKASRSYRLFILLIAAPS